MKLIITILLLTKYLYAKPTRPEKAEELEECLATREFVTTYRFLRSHEEYKISKKDAMKVADKVSGGCTGAAKRFIQITNLTAQAKLDTASSLKMAMKFAAGDDEQASTFITIFRQTYLSKHLDLDLITALKIAEQLTLKFTGNPKKASKDFNRMVEFCANSNKVHLSHLKCASLAAKVTKSGEKFIDEVAGPFIDLFKFIASRKGPNIPTYQALAIATEVIKSGPIAVKNFKQAYRYARESSELNFSNQQAVNLAKKLAARSFRTKK